MSRKRRNTIQVDSMINNQITVAKAQIKIEPISNANGRSSSANRRISIGDINEKKFAEKKFVFMQENREANGRQANREEFAKPKGSQYEYQSPKNDFMTASGPIGMLSKAKSTTQIGVLSKAKSTTQLCSVGTTPRTPMVYSYDNIPMIVRVEMESYIKFNAKNIPEYTLDSKLAAMESVNIKESTANISYHTGIIIISCYLPIYPPAYLLFSFFNLIHHDSLL